MLEPIKLMKIDFADKAIELEAKPLSQFILKEEEKGFNNKDSI